MKTKQRTYLESRLYTDLSINFKVMGEGYAKAKIVSKVQLISLPEFATLPKKIKIDKAECKEYLRNNFCGWMGCCEAEEIPDEINASTLYVGWIYKEKKIKYACNFRNERFDLRERRLIVADLARLYLIEKFLKEKGYSTRQMYLAEESISSVEGRILADIRSFYKSEEKLEQDFIAKAMKLGVDETVIRCCLNVERKYNKQMINFLNEFWKNGELLEDKVKKYLTEVGAM